MRQKLKMEILELPSKESLNDNSVKNYIKPYSESLLVGTYEGELKNGKPEGNGRFFHILGFIYKGEWKNGQKNGKGSEKGPQGEVYKGDWVNDQKNGKGTLELADGEIYEGDWSFISPSYTLPEIQIIFPFPLGNPF